MPEIPVLDAEAVLATVIPEAAIEHVRAALLSHHVGAWVMPPKVYFDCPPAGDFPAMPARGDGLALLKWINRLWSCLRHLLVDGGSGTRPENHQNPSRERP